MPMTGIQAMTIETDMKESADKAAVLLKALANEDRLLILCNLSQGEKNVSHLQEILGLRQAALSQQLARLRAERLVCTRRKGKEVFYSLSSNEAAQVIALLYELYCTQSKAVTRSGKRNSVAA